MAIYNNDKDPNEVTWERSFNNNPYYDLYKGSSERRSQMAALIGRMQAWMEIAMEKGSEEAMRSYLEEKLQQAKNEWDSMLQK